MYAVIGVVIADNLLQITVGWSRYCQLLKNLGVEILPSISDIWTLDISARTLVQTQHFKQLFERSRRIYTSDFIILLGLNQIQWWMLAFTSVAREAWLLGALCQICCYIKLLIIAVQLSSKLAFIIGESKLSLVGVQLCY